MLQDLTMKLSMYIISVVILLVFTQSIEGNNVHRQKKSIKEQLCKAPVLLTPARNLRGIRDVWAQIRESTINSWHYIKSMAENAKDSLNRFMENVKEHAKEIKNNFEKRLEELNFKLNAVIADLYDTRELVKQCLKREQDDIADMLKQIMGQLSHCIAGEIFNLTQLNNDDSQPAMNETKFIKELDDKMDSCERDMENIQECLCNVNEDIFDNFAVMEDNILNHHYALRNIADDIRGSVVSCSLDNLMDATNYISGEISEIAKCVLEAKEANSVE